MRARPVEAQAQGADHPQHRGAHRLRVREGHGRALEATRPLHPHLARAVDHDVGHVRVAQQLLRGPQPRQRVGQLRDQHGQRPRRQQQPLGAHRARDRSLHRAGRRRSGPRQRRVVRDPPAHALDRERRHRPPLPSAASGTSPCSHRPGSAEGTRPAAPARATRADQGRRAARRSRSTVAATRSGTGPAPLSTTGARVAAATRNPASGRADQHVDAGLRRTDAQVEHHRIHRPARHVRRPRGVRGPGCPADDRQPRDAPDRTRDPPELQRDLASRQQRELRRARPRPRPAERTAARRRRPRPRASAAHATPAARRPPARWSSCPRPTPRRRRARPPRRRRAAVAAASGTPCGGVGRRRTRTVARHDRARGRRAAGLWTTCGPGGPVSLAGDGSVDRASRGVLRPRQDGGREVVDAGVRPADVPRRADRPGDGDEGRLRAARLPAVRGRRGPHGALARR